MKRVLRYFPEKRFLKSKIFKRVLFSFAGIVLILFFIFTIYFYYMIYKKEYSDFIDRERNESLSTVLSLKTLSSELSLSVLYLKDSVKFLNMVNAPFDSLKDLLQPELDGISALKMIRNDPKLKDIPVIALTAYAMKGDRERFLESGFDDYIGKPIEIKNLLNKVEKYIER